MATVVQELVQRTGLGRDAERHRDQGTVSEQRERGLTHVRTSDFPETKSWMLEHVEAAGFRPGATFLEDEFFDGWAFMKP